MLAVGGDTAMLIEEGGGAGFEPVEQLEADSAAKMMPRWSTLRIYESTHQEPLDTMRSVRVAPVEG